LLKGKRYCLLAANGNLAALAHDWECAKQVQFIAAFLAGDRRGAERDLRGGWKICAASFPAQSLFWVSVLSRENQHETLRLRRGSSANLMPFGFAGGS